jgi:hypothetical protein
MKKLQVLTLAAVALLAAPIASFANHWTSVCSTGAIDEAAKDLYSVDGTSLSFASGKTGTIIARYNITNTGQTDTNIVPYTTLELGYTDTGIFGGSVQAIVYEDDPCTGVVTVLCSVLSADNSTGECDTCNFPGPFNFGTNLYHIAVVVRRSSTLANPTAHSLRLF